MSYQKSLYHDRTTETTERAFWFPTCPYTNRTTVLKPYRSWDDKPMVFVRRDDGQNVMSDHSTEEEFKRLSEPAKPFRKRTRKAFRKRTRL